ncbi:MAG: nucleotide exchange factor GrpE [Ottowia sp.]|jgi:molecular chaperone GrpE|nr:nucleotide exchange factor GrpE [Ottowia sp.]MBP7532308.1 nucleotide exchange factor GrpE [Ottowia sp.]MBP7535472.1 nucleotide exchange factor GrpE [Ottowia sp.]
MSDPRNTPPQPPFFDPMDPPMSPEELEAAAAANEADAAAQLDNALGEVETLKTKVAELTDQALRAQAEAQNARRRADDEIAKIRKFAVESFAESLLPVLDSLEAGLKVDNASAEQLREGTEATLRQLLAALERNKVVEVNPAAGDRFDPANQQAISMVPADQEANTVVSVLQKGYTIADRVLRPALVTVTAPK